MQPIKHAIEKVASAAFSSKGCTCTKLMLFWKNLLPQDFALKCFPYKVISYFEDKTQHNVLYIHSEEPYTSIFLSYNTQIILERIAIFLGSKEISKIKVKTISSSVTSKK